MGSEILKQFSDDLKKSREDKEITLQQIHAKTRIDLKYLESIEEGNFDVMDEVYIRAFLKQYAESIDLDAVKVLDKFDLAKKGRVQGEDTGTEKMKTDEVEKKEVKKEFNALYDMRQRSDEQNGSRKTNVIILIIAGIFIIGLIIIYFAYIKKPTVEIIAEKPYEEIIEEQNKSADERFELSPEIESSKVISKTEELVLRIASIDSAWIRAVIDDADEKEFILIPNSSYSLNANSNIKLLIGNSGGVALYLNNKLLNFQGRKREVKSILIDQEGLHYSNEESLKKNE